MNDQLVTCSLCGYRFDPQERSACPGCPLNQGCQLVCCPVCGFESVDINRSTLALAVKNLWTRRSPGKHDANREP